MFGICLLHSFEQGLHFVPTATKVLLSCVIGFVFISGWYGIRFRPSKLLRLYATAIACGSIVFTVEVWLGRVALEPTVTCVKSLCGAWFNYWFLNAYAVMMLLVPVVDAAVERTPPRLLAGILVPFLAVTFIWTFVRSSTPNEWQWLIPASREQGCYTGLTLLGTYTVARLCRRFDVARRFSARMLLLLLLSAFVCTMVSNNYSSPFGLIVAALVFFLFLRVRWPDWVGRVALFLGPSMFAVYLLHTNRLGFDTIICLEGILIDEWGWNAWCVYPLVAAILFSSALLLDQPRRLIVRIAKPLWRPFLTTIDTHWEHRFPQI